MREGYFKGWYFRCCAGEESVAFIPAYHTSGQHTQISLQVITKQTTAQIPLRVLKYRERPLHIALPGCTFGEEGIVLHRAQDSFPIEGVLRFGSPMRPQYDIMGPFACVPRMQCRHRLYSLRHTVNGNITIGSQTLQFSSGWGYIEGDRGYSFPNNYVWTQSFLPNGSVMLSAADIPLCGTRFTGIIASVVLHGHEYRLATYLGAKITHLQQNSITVTQGKYTLTAKLLHENAQPLAAPVHGNMCLRSIHESVACTAYYRFVTDKNVLCECISDCAAFEWEHSGLKI